MSDQMLVPMLKASVAMLEGCKPDKVECAKVILNQVIESLSVKPTEVYYRKISDAPLDEELDPEAIAAKEELME